MTEKPEPELVTAGRYRWIRNPIYSALMGQRFFVL